MKWNLTQVLKVLRLYVIPQYSTFFLLTPKIWISLWHWFNQHELWLSSGSVVEEINLMKIKNSMTWKQEKAKESQPHWVEIRSEKFWKFLSFISTCRDHALMVGVDLTLTRAENWNKRTVCVCEQSCLIYTKEFICD